jgi:hypothetical protein
LFFQNHTCIHSSDLFDHHRGDADKTNQRSEYRGDSDKTNQRSEHMGDSDKTNQRSEYRGDSEKNKSEENTGVILIRITPVFSPLICFIRITPVFSTDLFYQNHPCVHSS